MLHALIDQLNESGITVAWVQTLKTCAGFFVREHGVLVLAADRSQDLLTDIAREAVARVTGPLTQV